jgi:outer membrane protein assembly factor BamB
VVRLGEKDLLVLSGGNTIMAYDPRSGDELWSVKGTAESTVSTVVAWRDLLIASGGYPAAETVALRADGSVAWRNKEKTYVPSMIVVGDHLYFMQDDGIARCWDAATGKERWKHRVGGKYRTSPVLSGDNLIVTDMAGKTVVFRADPRKFEMVAENQLGTEGFASPAISDGHLFLRVAEGHGPDRVESLYCIGEQEPPRRDTRLPRGNSPR